MHGCKELVPGGYPSLKEWGRLGLSVRRDIIAARVTRASKSARGALMHSEDCLGNQRHKRTDPVGGCDSNYHFLKGSRDEMPEMEQHQGTQCLVHV